MLAQMGYGTPTLQRFWGCDENNVGGVLGVLINGVHYTGDTLTSDTDYTGIVDAPVSGTYVWQLTLDGVAVTEEKSHHAMPSAGERFKCCFWADATGDAYGWLKMQQESPDFAVFGGDWDYIDTEAGFTRDSTLSSYRPRHRTKLTDQPRRANFLSSVPNFGVMDSHEGVRGDLYAPGTPEYSAAYQAAREYFLCLSPENTDAGIHTSPSPVPYFRHTVSDVEFIFMDHISWAAWNGTDPVADVVVMDATQISWFQNAIQSSVADVIVVMAPHQPTYSAVKNPTVWRSIFSAINSVNKTVIMITGDSHGACAIWRPQGTTMASGTITDVFTDRGLLEVQATPIDHSTMTVGDAITDSQSTKHFLDASDSASASGTYRDNRNYGVLTYEPDGSAYRAAPHIMVDIKNAWDGALRWRCFVDVGGREPVIYAPRAAVPR